MLATLSREGKKTKRREESEEASALKAVCYCWRMMHSRAMGTGIRIWACSVYANTGGLVFAPSLILCLGGGGGGGGMGK